MRELDRRVDGAGLNAHGDTVTAAFQCLSWLGNGENVFVRSAFGYAMNERTAAQLRQIGDIHEAMAVVDVDWWLFGGWGLDARIGRITREHGDIELWVAAEDAERTRDAIVGAGLEYVPNDYPDESYEYVKDAIKSSSAFFLRNDHGSFSSR